MTAPASYYAAPQRPVQQVHTVTPPPQDDDLVRDIALVLAAGLTAKAEIAAIQHLLNPFGVTAQAVQVALGLSNGGTSHRPNARLARNGLRAATGQTIKVRDGELYFRAAYVMNSAHRLQQSLDSGKPIRVALSEESPYYRAHERARAGRMDAAAQVTRAASIFGPLLGWYLNPLKNNEAECIAADGHNFDAEEGTVIGLPGSVHPNCGCTAGPPIDGAAMVNDVLGNVVRFGSSKKLHKLRTKRTA